MLDIGRADTSGQSPDVPRITVPSHRIADRVAALRPGFASAVLEIIKPRRTHRGVADPTEVDPHLAILMPEHRGEREPTRVAATAPALRVRRAPGVPDIRRDRVCGRPEREQVDHHAFVITIPAARDETLAGMPAHRNRRRATTEPLPVGAGVDRPGETTDLALVGMVLVEIFGGKQHAEEQHRAVHRRQLDIAIPQAAVHVQEVVEESLMTGNAVGRRTLRRAIKEAQRRQRPRTCGGPADPAARHTDRIGCQRKADRCDAAESGIGPTIGDQAVCGIASVPEPAERAVFEIVQQGGQRSCPRRALGPSACQRRRPICRKSADRKERGGAEATTIDQLASPCCAGVMHQPRPRCNRLQMVVKRNADRSGRCAIAS